MNKDFEFKKLIKKKGFFCKINYEVNITEDQTLDLKCLMSNTKWYGALLFGANYFYEKYSRFNNKGIKIVITDIESQIIDTTNVVVFFTMVKLLSKETQFGINEFELNDDGNLILPK